MPKPRPPASPSFQATVTVLLLVTLFFTTRLVLAARHPQPALTPPIYSEETVMLETTWTDYRGFSHRLVTHRGEHDGPTDPPETPEEHAARHRTELEAAVIEFPTTDPAQ